MVSSTGMYEQAAVPCIADKLEVFLEIVEEQRTRHLRQHPELPLDAVFSDDHMTAIHNAWMEDTESWMKDETRANLRWYYASTQTGDRQRAHHLRRKAFSAYLFQIIGNKHIVLASIRHGICSAGQPARAILGVVQALEKEMSSDEYKRRVEISQKSTNERRALKNAATAARQAFAKGTKLHAAIADGSKQERSLSYRELNLLDDFRSGKLERDRDERDAAFGWNRERRLAAGSTAIRMRP